MMGIIVPAILIIVCAVSSAQAERLIECGTVLKLANNRVVFRQWTMVNSSSQPPVLQDRAGRSITFRTSEGRSLAMSRVD